MFYAKVFWEKGSGNTYFTKMVFPEGKRLNRLNNNTSKTKEIDLWYIFLNS